MENCWPMTLKELCQKASKRQVPSDLIEKFAGHQLSDRDVGGFVAAAIVKMTQKKPDEVWNDPDEVFEDLKIVFDKQQMWVRFEEMAPVFGKDLSAL